MKIKYLGTAAAEGIPGIFCTCDTCGEARKRKGRNIRTRSQAIIDERLLIDFPADTYMHCLDNDIELANIEHCLITHTHLDHLYLDDLNMRAPIASNVSKEKPLTLYGSSRAILKIKGHINSIFAEPEGYLQTKAIVPYEKTQVGEYTVTALNATHDIFSFPIFYIIEDKWGKSLLYAHDTNYFSEEVWKYLENNLPKFNLVSLDCTEANLPEMHYVGHMNLKDNVMVRNRMIEIGAADENTVFVSNHFSHNGIGVLYEEFSNEAEKEDFLTSYDGMEIEF